jgi:hypothetical protein
MWDMTAPIIYKFILDALNRLLNLIPQLIFQDSFLKLFSKFNFKFEFDSSKIIQISNFRTKNCTAQQNLISIIQNMITKQFSLRLFHPAFLTKLNRGIILNKTNRIFNS